MNKHTKTTQPKKHKHPQNPSRIYSVLRKTQNIQTTTKACSKQLKTSTKTNKKPTTIYKQIKNSIQNPQETLNNLQPIYKNPT